MIVYNKRIVSSFQSVSDAVHEVIDTLKNRKIVEDQHKLFKISFMLRELLNNAVEHGNRFDTDKWVRCEVSHVDRVVVFKVTDEGDGILFDDLDLANSSNELLRERHRGYQAIIEMLFKVDIEGTTVTVAYDLDMGAK
jgi:anti-sigma regulatory factor (Ser/Thr protein kinase)